MLAIINLWLKTMTLTVLCFIGYELYNLPKKDYTESLNNIEKKLNDIDKVLNDMNTLDYYNKGKKLK